MSCPLELHITKGQGGLYSFRLGKRGAFQQNHFVLNTFFILFVFVHGNMDVLSIKMCDRLLVNDVV